MSSPDVFVTPSGSSFHVRDDCSRLSISKSFSKVAPDDIGRRRPCGECTPVERVKFAKRLCSECSPRMIRPCAHNGGVQVWVPCTVTYYSALREPGDLFYSARYVWPDVAHRYTPVK